MSEQIKTEKRKRGRPPKKSYEIESKQTEALVLEKKQEVNYMERMSALNFEKLKELVLQDVRKNNYRHSVSRYTKDLVRQYILNPDRYQGRIRQLSRYLFRSNTLYRKIILYYACMPTYNYNITENIDLTRDFNFEKTKRPYYRFIKQMNNVDFKDSFAQMIALTILNGCYFGFVYHTDNDLFFHALDPDYCKIRGKNEFGKWLVAFDMSYFSLGYNVEYVEGIDGDMTGCWDDVFIQAWKNYKRDTLNCRWLLLPPEKTMCVPATLDDELDTVLPWLLGVFPMIMNCDDMADLMADKAEIENYKLLIGKIPMLDKSQLVDDFAVSLPVVQGMQELIDDELPSRVSAAFSPLDFELIDFGNDNMAKDVNSVSEAIHNVFENVGASELVVSSGGSNSVTALKYAISNDKSHVLLWLTRIEHEFNYVIRHLLGKDYTMIIHEQTIYEQTEYSDKLKDSATLGADPMMWLTSLGQTPYEVWQSLVFANKSGIRDLMTPLQSSYNMGKVDAKESGGQTKDDDNLSDEGIKTRDGNKNDAAKINKNIG